MILINFSHPLTAAHERALMHLLGEETALTILAHPVSFDDQRAFDAQADALVDAIALTPAQWQSEPILIVPPALSAIAVLVLAELHGRMGCFPAVVRMRAVAGSPAPRWEVAEILNLQQRRGAARQRRVGGA